MKFKIVSKGDERSNKIKATMKQYLSEFDLEYDKVEPDLVISVGETVLFWRHSIDIIIGLKQLRLLVSIQGI